MPDPAPSSLTATLDPSHHEKGFALALNNIRLGEFDLGGVLYHARYFHLYEMVREAFLEHIGAPYPTLVKDGYHLAITESHQRFFRPIVYGQRLQIIMWSSAVSRSTVTLEYGIVDEASAPDAAPHSNWNHSTYTHSAYNHRAWTRCAFVQNGAQGFRVSKLTPTLLHGFQSIQLAGR